MNGKVTSSLLLAGAMAAVGSSPSLAGTLCVREGGAGGCHGTIQQAVTAAVAGDRITIGPGVYYENVTVPPEKVGIQILGAGKLVTVLDAGRPLTAEGLVIAAARVLVANLTVRNGQTTGIDVDASGVVIRGVDVTGPNSLGIRIRPSAWNVQVLSSGVHDTSIGVYSQGFGAILKGNTLTHTTTALWAEGDASQVLLNRVSVAGQGLIAPADGVVVTGNDVRYVLNAGIIVSGAYPTVERNAVLGAGISGLAVSCLDCFGGSVSLNRITDAVGYGLYVGSDAPGLVVSRNTVLRTGLGLTLDGTGAVVSGNRASDSGVGLQGPCFEIHGDLNAVTANAATRCASAGFYVNGDDNWLERNTTLRTLENGFTVDGDNPLGAGPFARNVLTANRATEVGGQGFAIINAADATTLTANRAAKNRIDLCDEGTNTVESGNAFQTAGACFILH